MTIRRLPEIKAFTRPDALAFDPPADAMSRWDGSLRISAAAGDGKETTIDVLDVIGADWFGSGITAKSISSKLKDAGSVVVNINSPGGDFFEGVAIYNLLRAHAGKVTVNIMGLAASAASVIAMAGDEVNIARAGFLMIHNAWCLAMGDRHDMADAAEFLAPFDAAMVDVFAARTGKKATELTAMLDDETWIGGEDAVKQKFADALLAADAVKEDAKAKAEAKIPNAMRRLDEVLAKQGMPRSERRSLIKEIRGGTPGAASQPATHDAGLSDLVASLRDLSKTISS
jgi:ATP-dependent Clp protease protease subunit